MADYDAIPISPLKAPSKSDQPPPACPSSCLVQVQNPEGKECTDDTCADVSIPEEAEADWNFSAFVKP